MYTEAKKAFPRLGSIVHIDSADYRVDGFNVLSKSVKLFGPDGIRFVTLDDYNALVKKAIHPTTPEPTKVPAEAAAVKK